MAQVTRKIPTDAVEVLRSRISALLAASEAVKAWFEVFGQHHWLGGTIEMDAYSVPPAWVAVLHRDDISPTDKLWLIDAALVEDAAFEFDDACRVIGIDPNPK